jgi:hypothetical protein
VVTWNIPNRVLTVGHIRQGIVVYGSIIFVKLVHGRKRISFRDHVQSPFYNFGVLRVPDM